MADTKITDLTAFTTPVAADVFVMVDDPAGIPATKKITFANVEANLNHDNLTGFVTAEHIDWTGDAGASNIHVNNITAVPEAAVTAHVAAIDHDSLLNFASNEHFTQASITTVGTIGTGVWQGTAIDGTYIDLEGTELKSTGEAGGTKFLREDGDGTCSWQTIAGGGDALVANPLSQFAATTSAQFAGVISDETGTGSVVLATSPTLVTPALGTPASGVLTNCTGTASGLTAGNVTTNANLTGDVTSVGNATSIASGVIVNADINAAAAIAMSKTALVAGTNITLSTNTLNVDDAFLVNNADDTTTGTITAAGFDATGDTAAGDNASMGYTATEGLILTGQGSTNDVTIKNDADTAVIQIPTGTTNVSVAGTLTVTGDNSSADTTYVPNVLYNTDATPPTASTVPIGTLYVQYTA